MAHSSPHRSPQPGPVTTPSPPAGGPGRRRGASPAALVVGVVAVALLVGGCGDDGDGGGGGSDAKAADAKVLSEVPVPKVDDIVDAVGMWTTEKNFIKAGASEIVGYPPAGGKAEWKIPLDGPVCASSKHPTADGKIAVVFETAKDETCTQVALIDVNTHKLLWQRQAKGKGDYSPTVFDDAAVGGGMVAVGGNDGGAGWTLDGKPLWKPDSEAECQDHGYAGDGDKMVALVECGDPETASKELQTLKPGSRTATSTYKVAKGTEFLHLVSVNPLVAGATSSGGTVDRFTTIDDGAAEGKALSTIDTKAGKYKARCGVDGFESCDQVAVDPKSGTLYVGTDAPPSVGNKIAAIDLKTGKKRGESEEQPGTALWPIGFDKDGSVIVYEWALTEPGGVWRLDPKTYEVTKLLTNPDATKEAENELATDGQTLYGNGRLYMGATDISDEPDPEDRFALVLGAKS